MFRREFNTNKQLERMWTDKNKWNIVSCHILTMWCFLSPFIQDIIRSLFSLFDELQAPPNLHEDIHRLFNRLSSGLFFQVNFPEVSKNCWIKDSTRLLTSLPRHPCDIFKGFRTQRNVRTKSGFKTIPKADQYISQSVLGEIR